MISDVLAETLAGIDRYLNDSAYADIYEGELRERLVNLRNEAAEIQRYLDTSPSDPKNVLATTQLK